MRLGSVFDLSYHVLCTEPCSCAHKNTTAIRLHLCMGNEYTCDIQNGVFGFNKPQLSIAMSKSKLVK